MEHISNFLPVATERKELQKQEQGSQATGEEKRLELSLQSKLIKDASFDEVKESLRYVMMKVGLRAQNWPTDIEKLLLFEHIVTNFGGNSIEEIRLAFDMAISGQLVLKEGESVVCYENFSCLYFSSIMNAYRKWSSQAYRHVVKSVPIEQKIFSDEENNNIQREDAERQYRLFLLKYRLRGLEFNKSILVKDGLMKEEENVLNFFKSCYEKGYRHIYIQE